MYIFLITIYALIPPLILYYCLDLIYQRHNKYGWHLHYLVKYLISFTFLPLLLFPQVDLGVIPKKPVSILLFIVTIILSALGMRYAIKLKVLFIYIGGIYAAFMEEILFRGIIFGLAMAIWDNSIIALIVNSLAFGIWHLKNWAWHRDKKQLINQFLYTAFVYGPIFSIMRIYTGDMYLAILFHYITDATVALAPDWTRGWLVFGGRRKNDFDSYANTKS